MKSLVFDAGALIALERRQPRIWRLVQVAAQERQRIFVPAGVLAQVWRDDPRQQPVARLIKGQVTYVDPLSKETALQIGALLRRTGASDVVDGHVALLGLKFHAPVFTSDPDDISKIDSTLRIIGV